MNKELLDELEKKYGFVGSTHNEFIVVEKDKKWGYINSEGEEIVPCEYDFSLPFANGFALVEKDGEDGFIDKNQFLFIALVCYSLGNLISIILMKLYFYIVRILRRY